MSITGNRIKEIRKNKNLTQSIVSKDTGIGVTTLSNYETGYSLPDLETISLLAEYFGVSTDYLLGVSSSPKRLKDIDSNKLQRYTGNKIVTVPVLGEIPAGIPIEAIENIEDYEEIVVPHSEEEKDYFCLKVKGDSMAPSIADGDVVVCKRQPDAETGEIVAVYVNGYKATLKKIKKSKDGLTLIPINPAYDPMYYTREEVEKEPVKILGVVVESRRKF